MQHALSCWCYQRLIITWRSNIWLLDSMNSVICTCLVAPQALCVHLARTFDMAIIKNAFNQTNTNLNFCWRTFNCSLGFLKYTFLGQGDGLFCPFRPPATKTNIYRSALNEHQEYKELFPYNHDKIPQLGGRSHPQGSIPKKILLFKSNFQIF